tara:strand:- start:273 stop:485 length:213 start_codon:yes stop_codon:yes gene_type:complete
MEQLPNGVSNTTVILIERIFWLGLGVFLGLAIVGSLIRRLNENKKITKPFSSIGLKNLQKKSIQQNSTNK